LKGKPENHFPYVIFHFSFVIAGKIKEPLAVASGCHTQCSKGWSAGAWIRSVLELSRFSGDDK
jgi:hypothetical protein